MLKNLISIIVFISIQTAFANDSAFKNLQSTMAEIEESYLRIQETLRRSDLRLLPSSDPEVKEFVSEVIQSLSENKARVVFVKDETIHQNIKNLKPGIDFNSDEMSKILSVLGKISNVMDMKQKSDFSRLIQKTYKDIDNASRMIESLGWKKNRLQVVQFAASRLNIIKTGLTNAPIVTVMIRSDRVDYRLLKMPVIHERSLGLWAWDSEKKRSVFLNTPYERDLEPLSGNTACIVLSHTVTRFYRQVKGSFECYVPVKLSIVSALQEEFDNLGIKFLTGVPGVRSKPVSDYDITKYLKEVGQYSFVAINGEKLIQEAARAVAETAEFLN